MGEMPGWGGTQNLPRLLGLTNALPLILQGKEVRADKAKKLGLVDATCDLPSLEGLAVRCAKELAAGTLKGKGAPGKKKSWARWATEDFAPGRMYVFSEAKKAVAKSAAPDKMPAPYAILDCVRKGFESPQMRRENLQYEASRFVELAKTPTSSALIGLFDGMTALKKNRYARDGDAKPSAVAVLGAGLMGAGIAQVSAEKGLKVVLKDANAPALGKGESANELRKNRGSDGETVREIHSSGSAGGIAGRRAGPCPGAARRVQVPRCR